MNGSASSIRAAIGNERPQCRQAFVKTILGLDARSLDRVARPKLNRVLPVERHIECASDVALAARRKTRKFPDFCKRQIARRATSVFTHIFGPLYQPRVKSGTTWLPGR